MKPLLIIAIALLALLWIAPALAQGELYAARVEGLPEDFIMGMDVSSVITLENSGVRYCDANGNEKDLFQILRENGVNYIRVRVWNDPYDANGNGYGGGNCDIDTAAQIGARAAAQGMRLLVDFHYSDFWADPAKQQAPKAWEGMKIDEKEEAVYAYTRDCLKTLKEAGAQVGMVQLGNETNGKLCGEKTWMNIFKLMRGGARAVREADPSIRIAVHFANPESAGSYQTYASKLAYYDLDYDIFASSYYPFWHGSIENLKNVLQEIQTAYGKDVLIAETSYAYTLADTDFSGNSIGEGGTYEKPYPFTVQGQANAVADGIAAMQDIGGLGVFYWEGAWITVGQDSREANSALWEKYGSGWASSFAASYDPDDAGQHFGGSACDNQALFDSNGRALPSLAIFRLARTGSDAPIVTDAVEETTLRFDLGSAVVLPETVNAVLTDGSKASLPVVWEPYDGEAMRTGGPAEYTILGKADGMTAVCRVSMEAFNYIQNGDFEGADDALWTAVDKGATQQLYIEDKKSDSLSGTKHYHFYSAAPNSVHFTLEQALSNLPEGIYRYEISIMGGDGGETEIYSYVTINGVQTGMAAGEITVYNSWDTLVIEGIPVKPGDAVAVGISVRCKGAGAWGKIDDARMSRTR